MYQEKGLYRPYARLMKQVVNVPILCAGRMDDPVMAEQAIVDGTCDMVSLGRPLLADPDYVNKLRTDKVKSIRPCLSCQEGCMGRIQEYSALNCAVNPEACRERSTRLIPALRSKKVLVIGGGVAGCEAARVLKLRGHEPVLYEMSNRLGGNLIPGGAPNFKEDDRALADWYAYTLGELAVDVRLNAEATKADAENGGYDTVIIATGSKPNIIDLGDNTRTFTAEDVLMERVDPGEKTVVIGGGLVGCELALWLTDKGLQVTIVEAMPRLLALNAPLCHANSEMLERIIPFKGIGVKTGAQAESFHNRELKLCSGEQIECDSVILAIGYKENDALYKTLDEEIPELYLLGDACKVSNIMYAIWNAFEVASVI